MPVAQLWDVRDASSEAALVEAQQSSAGLPGRVKGVAAGGKTGPDGEPARA